MEEQIKNIQTESISKISQCKDEKELNDLKVKYLGKKEN